MKAYPFAVLHVHLYAHHGCATAWISHVALIDTYQIRFFLGPGRTRATFPDAPTPNQGPVKGVQGKVKDMSRYILICGTYNGAECSDVSK